MTSKIANVHTILLIFKYKTKTFRNVSNTGLNIVELPWPTEAFEMCLGIVAASIICTSADIVL